MRVCVVGAGYVGLTTAAVLAHTGHQVVCVDTHRTVVQSLQRGVVPFCEPGLEHLVREMLRTGALVLDTVLTPVYASAQVVLVCVSQAPAVLEIARVLAREWCGLPLVVAIRSWVPPGTAQRVSSIMTAHTDPSWHRHLHVVVNPHFLRRFRALWDSYHPRWVVIGCGPGGDPAAAAVMRQLYYKVLLQRYGVDPHTHVVRDLVDADRPLPRWCVTDWVTAETTPYAVAAGLATQAAYTGDVMRLCAALGADARCVAAIAATEATLPGCGLGCSVAPLRDLVTIATQHHVPVPTPRAAYKSAAVYYRWAADQLQRVCAGATRVAVLGVTPAWGAADLSTTPVGDLIRRCHERGLQVVWYDPDYPVSDWDCGSDWCVCPTLEAALQHSGVVVVLRTWPGLTTTDWAHLRHLTANPVIWDLSGDLDHCALQQAGWVWLDLSAPT